MKSPPDRVLTCPLHDTAPECELVVVRHPKTVSYALPDGTERSYRVKGIRYYRVRCRKCFDSQYDPECPEIDIRSPEEHVLAYGVTGKSKAEAVERWNSAVGDIQVRRLVDSTKGEDGRSGR